MKAIIEKKKHCQSCNAKFGLTTHKHMCKRCHSIICSECTKQKIQIIQYTDKKPHKICLNCSDDYQHNTNLKVTGKLQWAVDSNIMKQWLKNINTIDKDKLQKQYEDILQTTSPLIKSEEFQEYVKNIEQQINAGNSMKHFNYSFLEMVHSVWGQEPDIHKIKQQIINVMKAFFIDFPDQESPLTFKQEYVDFAVFLLIFGQESSVWRMMKEIYGIIIPIESISHITNNDFNYGEKYLMNFLLDKINYDFNSQECNNIYRFIQDRGIELINSFFANQANFQTSYQIFNNVINIPYNRRWSELLRSLGVFIIENKDVIGQNYEKVVWDEMKTELNINTKWKRMKEKMDVYIYFQIADNRQMNRFSMIEDCAQSEMDSLLPSTEDIIEENKMLKKEVFQIFKVKQLITQKMDELDEMRMELQKRELVRQKYEDNLKKFNEVQQKYNEMRQSYQELQQDNQFLQEKLMRFSTNVGNQNYITYEDSKRTASLINLGQSQQQKLKQNINDDEFLTNILKDKERLVNTNVVEENKIQDNIQNDNILYFKKTSSVVDDYSVKNGQDNLQVKENNNICNQNHLRKESVENADKKQDNEQINSLKKDLEDLENKNKYYLSQFQSQGDQILKYKLDLSKKDNEIEKLKEDLSKEKDTHAETKLNYEKQLLDQKNDYEQKINQLKDENQINQLEQKYKSEQIQLKEKIDQLNLYNQILQQEKTELFLQKQNLFQQVNSLNSQISSSQGENQEVSANKPEIDTLRNTITKLELEINSLKDDNSQLEKKLITNSEKEQIINTLQFQVKNLQQEIKDSTSQSKQQTKLSDNINNSELSTSESANKSPTLNFVKNEVKSGENE